MIQRTFIQLQGQGNGRKTFPANNQNKTPSEYSESVTMCLMPRRGRRQSFLIRLTFRTLNRQSACIPSLIVFAQSMESPPLND
ncbi:hypothetical protein RB7296 [Rhodopirellula baltica SH 1]|uniref:Uncharacterized protein n=1 Tax=Rhodopirellula baltica (strain DSM 10527 / NCIMB 13988 / SH1) TaxID=243090 RepID=Q7UNX1_RHOBA|nr:hypothetical protein RB7296 [Rhodopirellula baltica SH 1]